MDRSFEGLLFSVIVHAILLWLLIMGKFSVPVLHETPTEITLVEREDTKKRKAFVTETDLKPALDELEDKVDMLSKYTKRVKKQMKASRTGPTVNAVPRPSQSDAMNDQSANKNSRERQMDDGDIPMRPMGQSQSMRTVAIGASSLAEYIPGVQEGSFTALNTDSFTYYTFFNRMNEQVRNRWVSLVRNYVNTLTAQHLEKLSRQERHSVVEIVLGADGAFKNAYLHRSSGDDSLDLIPGQSFKVAAPFPNPPRGLVESDGQIHLKYAFVIQFRPPSLGPADN